MSGDCVKPLKATQKAVRIVRTRLRNQGLRTTLIWLYARGVPKLTGRVPLRYSAVTPQLYVGPQYGPAGKRMLERAGIRAGISLRGEYDDAAHGLALEHYCYLPTVDETAPSMAHLDQGVDFVGRMIAAGEKVYIHCAGGVGRAPTLAAAYLITQGYTLDTALDLIRTARPFIQLEPPQLEQLQAFAAHHHGDSPTQS
ncbi:MAG: dual specificity protein phosphatase family protein [Chloroflexi bacterium]|nr:dual specificity protein phosphatase family protein [Chloroflexota bacterium]